MDIRSESNIKQRHVGGEIGCAAEIWVTVIFEKH